MGDDMMVRLLAELILSAAVFGLVWLAASAVGLWMWGTP